MNDSRNSNINNRFNEKIHGIPCIRIGGQEESALVAAQGAQVVSWVDRNGKERLYLSRQTRSLNPADGEQTFGPAIRGGVPVCFPQFSDRGPIMKHGFVRNRIWELGNNSGSENMPSGPVSSASLRFTDDEATHTHWPHRFDAQLHAEIRPNALQVRLQITNPGNTALSFTVALHTYLRVADIRQTYLLGLQGAEFEDATKKNIRVVQNEEQLRILDETDRVYLGPPAKLVLYEGASPSLQIEQQGFPDTVVWNPGPDKAQALTDFPDDDWLHMLCVEAASVAQPVSLQPGQTWTGSQILTIPTSA